MFNYNGNCNSGINLSNKLKKTFSPAERIGFCSFALSITIFPFYPDVAALPLTVFLLLCFMAPLIPHVGFFLPIISKGRGDIQAVALTFDDGPDPLSTLNLLKLLNNNQIVATFFVTGERAKQYPDIIREILIQGHSIGNHTLGHDNLIMLKSSRTLMKEIAETQNILMNFGITPVAFRPPVGITSPRLSKVLRQVGMSVVNFNRRAGDRGNRSVKNISGRILKKVRPGDIIMLHDIPPRIKTNYHQWVMEVERVLSGIKAKGLVITPLSKLINQPVMIHADNTLKNQHQPN